MAGGWNWMVFEGPFHPKPFCESTVRDVRSSALACRGYPKPVQGSSLASRHPEPEPLPCPACRGTFLCFSPLRRSWQGFATGVSLCGPPSDDAGSGQDACHGVQVGMCRSGDRRYGQARGTVLPHFSSLSFPLALPSLSSPLSLI